MSCFIRMMTQTCIMDYDSGFLSLLNGRNLYVIITLYYLYIKLLIFLALLFSYALYELKETFIISANRCLVINCIHITIAYPITSSLFYNSNFDNTSVMMDINQLRLNSEYYTIYNISFVFYMYVSLTEVYFICIWIPIHIIFYIDSCNSFILSSHYDSFYRYKMYFYIRICSHYVTYLVNYQYLKLNTKHGPVGTQCWVHKSIHFLNFDFINPCLQIQRVYILSSPMYDYYKKCTIYHHNLYPNRSINQLFEYINYSMYLCRQKVVYLVYPVYFLITQYFLSSWLYTCILIIQKFFISTIIHMIPFTFYLTPILHLFYSLSISSYDASLQAHDHSLRTFIANIAQEHVYCKERPSRTNPFTSLNYFTVPITNIISLPVLTIPVYNLPYNNLSDDCLIDELTPENNAVNEININNPLDSIIDPDHIDYSVLGSIDPDTNFLLGNDTSLCHYFTELEFNQCFPSDDKFSLFNLNIRSLPKNIEKVQHFLEGLHYKFTILSFTETWLAEYNSSLHNFIGYSHVYKLRDKNRRGGGVSMFIDSRINYQDRNDINIDIEYVDTLAIEIPKEELNTNHNTVIISIYRPPSIQQNLFTDKLTDLLNYLTRENKHIYILGDFNIDTSSTIINPNIGVNNFQNTFLSYFYTPLIDKFTRVDKKRESSTLLDNIYTNVTPNANSIKSGVFKTDISDHYSIFCITDFVTMGTRKKEFRTKRDFSKKNISNFRKSLKKIDWNHLTSENFQTSFSSFYRKFCDIFKYNFPERTIKIGYKNRLPYLTKALHKSIEHKHILNHIFKKNPTLENKLKCSIFNNKLTSLLRIREKEYYEEQLELNKNELTKSWKIIKEIIGKKKTSASNSLKFNINGKQVSDKFTISNAFNNYFVEIGPLLERSIHTTVNPLTYVKSSSNSMFMPYVEEHEITEIVYKLKESSAGCDSIPAFVAKATIQSYIKPLTSLINSSFENGVFPDELKITKVIPIFKNGDKTDITNYRPISVLSFFSKIFEKTMNNCLIKFIDKHDILYKYQFGFRKSHSTSHAIISLVEKINNALDSGQILIGVFFGPKKSFRHSKSQNSSR